MLGIYKPAAGTKEGIISAFEDNFACEVLGFQDEEAGSCTLAHSRDTPLARDCKENFRLQQMPAGVGFDALNVEELLKGREKLKATNKDLRASGEATEARSLVAIRRLFFFNCLQFAYSVWMYLS